MEIEVEAGVTGTGIQIKATIIEEALADRGA